MDAQMMMDDSEEITEDDVREVMAHRTLISFDEVLKIFLKSASERVWPEALSVDVADVELEIRPDGLMFKFLRPEPATCDWPLPEYPPW
jgi:hypothetical protein